MRGGGGGGGDVVLAVVGEGVVDRHLRAHVRVFTSTEVRHDLQTRERKRLISILQCPEKFWECRNPFPGDRRE